MASRLHRRTAVVVVCASVACSHPPQAADPVLPGPLAGIHLATNDLWSGGEVTIISSSFKSLTALPTVQIGGVTAAARRVDDSTIAAQLPDADAVLAVHMAVDSFLPFDTSISVHGFQQMRIGPIMPGIVQALPGQASVIGAGAVGLIELDLRNNVIVRQFPDSVHSIDCARAVGQSVQPGHFVFYGRTGPGSPPEACGRGASSWQYGTTPVRTGVLNVPPGVWGLAEIGSGGWIYGVNSPQVMVNPCGSPGCGLPTYTCACGEYVTGITIGALAHRAVVQSFASMVINSQTGDSVYRLPFAPNTYVSGAVFSAVEDTMYVLGNHTVMMVNSANGTVYRTVDVPNPFGTSGIGRDDRHPWIYMLSIRPSTKAPDLTVLDARTLATVAIVRAPASAVLQANDGWDAVRFVRDPGTNRLFAVVTGFDPPDRTRTSRIISYGVPFP